MKNKIKKIFLEMPSWNDNRGTQKPQDYDWSDASRKIREEELKGYNTKKSTTDGTYVYTGYEDNYGGDISFVVARLKDSDEPLIGELMIEKLDKFRYPAVMSVHILPKHRGKGVGSMLYEYTIDLYGGIISDRSLSGYNEEEKGSFHLWQSLCNKKNYPCYLLQTDKGKVIKTIPIAEITRELMGSDKERFMAIKKPKTSI